MPATFEGASYLESASYLMNFKPIGVFESEQVEPYQAGRQPDELGLLGKIKLNSGENFEQALLDLDGCTHIWIIFGFHLNNNWKPLVQTPRSQKKIGVFATRAPYRPNPIGMSLVKLIHVVGLEVAVGENDILNGSPIFDIKPYHPESDLAADAKIKWLENSELQKHSITISPFAEDQLEFLEKHNIREISTFINRQLEYDPLNKSKKRVEPFQSYWCLAYRTWRIDFSIVDTQIGILSIRSGYTAEELMAFEDPYSDKKVHRLFKKEYS